MIFTGQSRRSVVLYYWWDNQGSYYWLEPRLEAVIEEEGCPIVHGCNQISKVHNILILVYTKLQTILG